MLDEFLAFFNSLTKSMDIIYVLKGLKPVSRIIVNEDSLSDTKEFLKKHGIEFAVSDFKISAEVDENQYTNKGTKLAASSKEKGRYFVYLSKDKEFAEKAKKAEDKQDHLGLGKLLGYPECCCKFFEKNYPAESKKKNDYVLAALGNSEGFNFPFYTNITVRHMDLNLISHFPCNFKCKESIEIAKKNLELLKDASPDLGEISAGMLKGVVIYTEKDGIFLLRDCKVKGDEIEYKGVMSSVNNHVYELLKDSEKIKIMGRNHIKTDADELKSKDIGAFIFS